MELVRPNNGITNATVGSKATVIYRSTVAVMSSEGIVATV
jgi:hypothetical protein